MYQYFTIRSYEISCVFRRPINISSYLLLCIHGYMRSQPFTIQVHPNSYHCKYSKRTRQPRDFVARSTRRSVLLVVWWMRRCVINLCPKSVQPGSKTPPLTPTLNELSLACSKCGTSKKSGERSCCARGGSWFRNCGDESDGQFEHTWVEGIQACKSKCLEPEFVPPTPTSNNDMVEDGFEIVVVYWCSCLQQKHPRQRDHLWEAIAAGVPSAALSLNLGGSAAVLAMALGSRNAEILTT